MLATFMSISPEQAELNQELRAYAERMPVTVVQPTLEEAIAAIQPHFPKLTEQVTEVQSLLEDVGLPVITDVGGTYRPMRISWSITKTQEKARECLTQYTKAQYQSIRDAFGINYHWIFLVPSGDLLVCTDEKLMDGLDDFEDDGMPSCWILKRFY